MLKIKKNDLTYANNLKYIGLNNRQEIRILLIFLIIHGVVSYRSTPRILEIFDKHTSLNISWIPHFSSVINWTERLGIGRLKQIKPITQKWVAILDHSIDIGIKKVFVILRVKMTVLDEKGSALSLKDCECIYLKVSTKVTGETISEELKECYDKAGTPTIIIKDRDSTLNKGVSLYIEKHKKDILVVDDITHVVANALKKQFENNKSYKLFIKILKNGANKLRQTDIAFLIPPKLRNKGRFQSVNKLNKWAQKMMDTEIFATRGRAKKGSRLERLREAFPSFNSLKSFMENFAKTTNVTTEIMGILKNEGLNQSTNDRCKHLIKKLPKSSKTRKIIRVWLEKHIKIQKGVTIHSMPVSSDIIESLFGKFKNAIERSPRADINRTALLIPIFCGNLDESVINEALNQTKHKELKKWEEENIPYTLRKERQKFFKNYIQK